MASKANKYQILRMETIGTPPLMCGKVPWVFDDPAEALAYAKQLTRELGEKLCVKPIINGKWRDREFQKLHDGTYRRLPWHISGARWWHSDAAHAIWKDHYPHASLEKPGWIAFTKSEEDGEKDKQTLLRPGAYLNRYFEKVMGDHGVGERGRVEEFMRMYGPIEVKFAETEEDILKVYEHGPKTCMNDKRWPKDINPVSIYAAGDLQVAYLGNLDEKVSGRTLVWPAKKIHSRVYGDIARLTQGLERLGYKWGAPIGAKLKRIQLHKVKFDGRNAPQGCFLAPYLDKRNQQGGGHLSFIDKGDHLVICEEGVPGSHHCGGADGYSGSYVPRAEDFPTFTCDCCEKQVNKVYSVFTESPEDADDGPHDMWCAQCVTGHAFRCVYSDNYFSNDVPKVTVDDMAIWAKYYADMYAECCEGNGRIYNTTRMKEVWLPDGTKKRLSPIYIRDIYGSVFMSNLTKRCYPKTERLIAKNRWGDLQVAKSEMKQHLFQCDGCDDYWVLEERFQQLKDDRLFCRYCATSIKDGHEAPISKTRKAFEKERAYQQAAKQLVV